MGQIQFQAERQELPTAEGNHKSRELQVLDREQSPCVQPSMQSTTTTAPSTMRRAAVTTEENLAGANLVHAVRNHLIHDGAELDY